MKSRIFTVPNQLTFLRLAFLPFFIIAIKYDRYVVALAIFVVAGFSDGLDGLLARSLNQRNTARRLSGSHRGQAVAFFFLFRAGAEREDRLVAGDSGPRPRRFAAGGVRGDSAHGRLPARFRRASGERPPRSSRFRMVFLVLLLAVWDNHLHRGSCG